jgi:hypothetical protein
MTNSIFKSALAGNIHALHDTLSRAMVDATTACRDLEDENPRAAVGAVVPIAQALQDARAILDTILILNRQLD